jgi:hypothetical protein
MHPAGQSVTGAPRSPSCGQWARWSTRYCAEQNLGTTLLWKRISVYQKQVTGFDNHRRDIKSWEKKHEFLQRNEILLNIDVYLLLSRTMSSQAPYFPPVSFLWFLIWVFLSLGLTGPATILYVIYTDEAGMWRVQCVAERPNSFANRCL